MLSPAGNRVQALSRPWTVRGSESISDARLGRADLLRKWADLYETLGLLR
jgi:hypothetical protein